MPEGRGDGPRRVVDHFAVLGLTPEATDADVRRAYRGLARGSHPDRGGDAEEFARVSAAYEALRGPGARERLAVELRVQARRDEMARGRPGSRPAAPPPTARPGAPGPTARPGGVPGSSGRPGGVPGSPGRPGGVPRSPGRPGGVPGSSGRSGTRPASRLSQAEQDRLIDEFLRSHPEARRGPAGPGAGPAAGAGRGAGRGPRPGRAGSGRAGPGAGRRRRRVRRALVAVLAVAALAVVAQPLLPEPVQEALTGLVEVVSP